MHNIESNNQRKFLVIQTAFIGDVILSLPVISKLKRFYPESSVDILVRKGNESLLENNPNVNEVIIFDKRNKKYRNTIKVINTIRKNKYDVVVNIQRYATTGLITALSGANVKIGFDKNPLSVFYTKKITHIFDTNNKNTHEVHRNLSLIQDLTDSSFEMPKMYPSQKDFEIVKIEKPYFCLLPGSVWFTKQYPENKWVELMNELPNNYTLVLMGGKGDKDYCQQIIDQCTHPDVQNKAGELSFNQSAAIMQNATMNFVNDSAPLHICSAVNAPVRAMFCSTIPAFGYFPLSKDSKVLESPHKLECRPCGLHGKKECPKGHFKCGDIPVSIILDSLQTL
nr:glycosyltransferase family 9 protein [uncultured Carboxylicivirga sp.]